MAKLALTAIGMGVGFMLGGPMGAQIGAMIGSEVGNLLFPTKVEGSAPEGPRGHRVGLRQHDPGSTAPRGSAATSSGRPASRNTSTSRAARAGVQQTTYTYTASFAIAFCKGPVDSGHAHLGGRQADLRARR
jgi:hypothetical protein